MDNDKGKKERREGGSIERFKRNIDSRILNRLTPLPVIYNTFYDTKRKQDSRVGFSERERGGGGVTSNNNIYINNMIWPKHKSCEDSSWKKKLERRFKQNLF